jgi:nucleoside-diphosphate-sugar epimerase
MHVLVLGANGFIGSTIVAALIRAGMKVTGLVRDPETGFQVLNRSKRTLEVKPYATPNFGRKN